jgi:FlaA1/EpsC-like NDP-sugar epimerase
MDRLSRLVTALGIRRYQPLKFMMDLILWTLTAPLAFFLRLDMKYLVELRLSVVTYTSFSLIVKAALIYSFALQRQSWHKTGTRDLFHLIRATATGTLVLLAAAFIINPHAPIPRSIPLIDGALALLALGSVRLATRLLYERDLRRQSQEPGTRVLVVGAGEAGTLLVREMLRHPDAGMTPIGYLDDDEGKQQTSLVGAPVVGKINDLPAVVKRLDVEEILIAMPSAPGEAIRQVVELARQAEVKHRIMPSMFDILSGNLALSQIREVDVEDLLRREPVELNLDEIEQYLKGRVVLITGGGGSIGSELVRQITRFGTRKIILLDRDENNLYLFERELKRDHPDLNVEMLIADIRWKEKLERIFDHYRPQVVFHTAAHKHVPVMESNPDEAILNNIGGTRNLLEVALQYNVERFVNISTDKAIRPTSIMGASKRVAEQLVRVTAKKAAVNQAFVSVRFGNVLGSRGSVVPIFKEQIRRGGPVTLTHPKMTRYFMSIPEATQLVLQAAALSENGAVYMLDMGEPSRIIDLAVDLIRLSGLKPYTDIDIELVGPRPGEKITEELLTAQEGAAPTKHEKIFIIRNSNYDLETDFDARLERLLEAARSGNSNRIRSLLQELVLTYDPTSQVR